MLSYSVCAETDPPEDIYHFHGYGADKSWDFYGQRDAIDIIDVSQSVSGSDIMVSLSIKGGISDEATISYNIYLYKDPTSYYAVDYNQGSGMASANGNVAAFPVDTDPDFVISDDGKTLSYTFSDIDTSIDYDLEAYAVEHAEYGDIAGEAWYDYAPENTAPYTSGENNGSNDGNNGGESPGFEILVLFVAFGAVCIFVRKIKKR
jgi:hypothetical protein